VERPGPGGPTGLVRVARRERRPLSLVDIPDLERFVRTTAVTKADIADPERARAEVRELVDDDVPVVACWARTGMGVDGIRAALPR
jgi:hypothetical protein